MAIVVGLFVALIRLYGPAPLRWLFSAYVEVLRGTPLLLQLVTIYYVLPPAFGFSLNPVLAAVLGLAVNYSAYESEIYRAGLLAIPVGQMEAALSLGMSRAVALRRVIVPQAIRLVIPPVTNETATAEPAVASGTEPPTTSPFSRTSRSGPSGRRPSRRPSR